MALIRTMSEEDSIDKRIFFLFFLISLELSHIYELIDSGRLIEAFEKIRSQLFTFSDIPVIIDRLRLRFSCIFFYLEYYPSNSL